MMGVMGLNRVFMMMSKANASAHRIQEIVEIPEDLLPLPESEAASAPDASYLIFDDVSFQYLENTASDTASDTERFAGGARQQCLEHISFRVQRGGSLGIIGATGSGKTSIVNLLMRFYDPQQGHVFVDGKDVRVYDRDELHRKFGVVFQNDVLFADTIRENISFGRDLEDQALEFATRDAMAAEFVEQYDDGFDHMSVIHGANFSGGQKQRLLIARALAAHPEILILDDSSSALDYRTDASLRQAIDSHHSNATTVIIAQRISSIMNLDEILVLDEGRIIGQGTHQHLMDTCPVYHDLYYTQMGEVH